MIAWLKRIFSKPTKHRKDTAEIAAVDIAAGQRWVLCCADGPWEAEKNYPPVLIRDVKDGWVRYAIGSTFPDCRHTIKVFVNMYRRVS